MTDRRPLAAAVIVAALAVLALAGWWLARGEPRLPADALAALMSAAGSESDSSPSRVQLLEVERIGPDFAVIYRYGGRPAAAVLVGGQGTWAVETVADPGALSAAAQTGAGAVTLVADGLQVVFVAIPDRHVARVAVRFPADGTVLTARRHRDYAIVWRPAGPAPLPFIVETFDPAGNRLNP